MDTEVTEIAADIFRLSTFVDEADLPMNQFLIRGDEPLLFHTGMPMLYPSVSAAVSKLLPLDTLRWITFGHVEADESGSMNRWLAAAPRAQVAHGAMGCFVQIDISPTVRRGRSTTGRSSTSAAARDVASRLHTFPTVGTPD